MSEDLLYELCEQVLEFARHRLDIQCDSQPARAYVVAGPPVWDNCCDGQLTVNITGTYPSKNFPAQDASALICSAPYTAVNLDVTIMRCAPVISTEDGDEDATEPPTPEALAASAKQTYREMYAVWQGVMCGMNSLKDTWQTVFRQQIVNGPLGGCVGSTLSLTVGLNDNSCGGCT